MKVKSGKENGEWMSGALKKESEDSESRLVTSLVLRLPFSFTLVFLASAQT